VVLKNRPAYGWPALLEVEESHASWKKGLAAHPGDEPNGL
jgi:hypothetical protein